MIGKGYKMTTLLNVTPDAEETKKDIITKGADDAKTAEGTTADVSKPPRAGKPTRMATPVAKVAEAPARVKWIRLDKGGTYGYKRAIYEQGKVYEVDLATAEHLLSQYYTLGNSNETVDVYYFVEVKRK